MPETRVSSKQFKELQEKFAMLGPANIYPETVKVFQQGATAGDVYFIEDGVIKLVRSEQDGRDVIVDLRFPGWLIGTSAVILRKPHLVTGITINQCRLRRISSDAFRQLLMTDAELSWKLHQMHCSEIHCQILNITQLCCGTARHRLENLLWQLISAEGNGSERNFWLRMPLKNWEIADLVAVAPGYLSRLLNELETDGTLKRHKGWLVIADPEKLWRCNDS